MSNTITPIIGGINNISTSTCGSIIGGINNTVIGTCGGHTGITGITGHQGTTGPQGYMIDWKEDMMKKYPRFTITTEYDTFSFSPTNIIIDNNTNTEYKFKPSNMSDIMNETEQFIKELIVTIRDEKITTIINGSKD